VQNFSFYNPTRIVFGRGAIGRLAELIPAEARVLLTYGGGSIKRNGVYDQVMAALEGRIAAEFGGIEPNPHYETCMEAVEVCRRLGIDFLLAVGGGSVLDGTKFIAAAARFEGVDPWSIVVERAPIREALPLGSVLTLPATGSESNMNAVITRVNVNQKRAFSSEHVIPRFAILDPETTFSLPPRQTQNGIVDAFVHVMEQYMTYPAHAPLQDRQAEGILLTLIEEGPKAIVNPSDYDARANIMWCATQALNHLIGCGVPQDWSSHMIGHELTALYGVDHGQSLAVVLPSVLRHQRAKKAEKLLQYGQRVWGISEGDETARIDAAIDKTEAFFRSLGVKTKLAEYGIVEGIEAVGQRIEERGAVLGEHNDIDRTEVDAILEACR